MGLNSVLACKPESETRCCHSAASFHDDQLSPCLSDNLAEVNVEQLLDSTFGDEPTSPQSVRAWTKQIKRVSRLHRQRSHNAVSEASTACAAGNEQATWETALDNLSSDRRSSTHSTGSSAPSLHVPDGTRTFGKILFKRRTKSKRNDGSRASSASSVYSVEIPADNASAGTKEFLPSIFSRRRTQRDETTSKRPQISGPFNFQHVEHRLPEERSLEASLTDGTGQGLGLVLGPVDVNGTSDNRSVSLPTRCIAEQVDDLDGTAAARPGLVPRHTSPIHGLPRLTKMSLSRNTRNRSSSAAQIPRSHTPSPTLSTFSSSSALPLRRSSRWMNRPKVRNLVALHDVEKLEANDGSDDFRPSLPDRLMATDTHAIICHDHLVPLQDEALAGNRGFCQFSRPLPPPKPSLYDRELPEVPEEEEQHGQTVQVNRSSLRGSQSVPLMRSASETTWPLCETVVPASRVVAEPLRCPEVEARVRMHPPLRRESWEDDIDYCYEHEAEADCNYQWNRPSMETARDFDTSPVSTPVTGEEVFARHDSTVPDLSPASQGSIEYSHGPVTPTFCPPMAHNTSFARVNAKNLESLELDCNGRNLDGPSYKESQFFTLSPSLLIPGEFQQELILAETEVHGQTGVEGFTGPYRRSAFYEDSTSTDGCSLKNYQRGSFSTTESTYGSDSTETRHMSTVSSRTTLTHHTASSTSLNKMASSEPARPADVVPELVTLHAGSGMRRCNHKSHASEPLVVDEKAPLKSTESPKSRRQRARTASLSNQVPPPVGQYAIFPRAYVKLTGDMI
ncbi:hypothetical protein HIM_07178 [Hirsutella minnesotensis 3608]|uniref:CRIB domain-containing protein n=1 Tax=Hirsutella minnesotensis 3608 TaxID=1043627 RepID=A0A0F8A4D4_9HYPO|nr:hypothetical protein HIM_07178 [Hirsutella minnesotensis 3608]